MGHASMRTNGGGTPIRAEEPTIASMLKSRGYATGGFGKWAFKSSDLNRTTEESDSKAIGFRCDRTCDVRLTWTSKVIQTVRHGKGKRRPVVTWLIASNGVL